MKIIYWDDLIKGENIYPQGSAISIGGFDGPHRGHERILSAVLKAARKDGIPAGIITFFRSPRSVKAGNMYAGDVSTLEMRLQKFAEQGFSFTVLIDFSADFARMKGTVFFDILIKTICIKYLAVGSDFTCGYRHDTGVGDLQRLARERGFCFDSIEQLYSARHERISSSAIRQAVEQADFALAKDLLGYPFFLDVAKIVQRTENGVWAVEKAAVTQILPQNGQYSARAYLQTGAIIPVQVKVMDTLLEVFEDTAAPIPFAAETLIRKLEFIRKE
ncbi:FAD synthetase family protein [Treponema vincentii]|jgi:riboflavin kinase/FMN adenylyltransferase|uniref:FAD synthase n=1 Tax=Treponema vincentii TaxID=69710 RepID=A0A6P1Y066_9SPIR|nr:FAD synthetase family protein [Treponema vincentii]QHX42650.1 FAD synthetase family protein [Treponema vincentii]